jgi:hypothetical protein
MDIATIGRSVFRIHDLHNDKPYLEGTVEMLQDDLRPGPAEPILELRALFDQCYRLLHGKPPDVSAADTTVPLSYWIGAALPLDLEVLQQLLELRVEAGRQDFLVGQLKELLAHLERVGRVRSRAAGNGHGPV